MLSVIDLSATQRRLRSSAMSIRWRRLRASRFEAPDDQHIALTGDLQRLCQFRAIRPDTGCGFDEQLATSSRSKGVELQGMVLWVHIDPSVSDLHDALPELVNPHKWERSIRIGF